MVRLYLIMEKEKMIDVSQISNRVAKRIKKISHYGWQEMDRENIENCCWSSADFVHLR